MTTRTKSNFFKPGDFQDWGMHETPDDESPSVSEWCAEQANAIFSKYIEENGLTVYHDKITHKGGNFGLWHEQPSKDDTHSATLLFIEEMK